MITPAEARSLLGEQCPTKDEEVAAILDVLQQITAFALAHAEAPRSRVDLVEGKEHR